MLDVSVMVVPSKFNLPTNILVSESRTTVVSSTPALMSSSVAEVSATAFVQTFSLEDLVKVVLD